MHICPHYLNELQITSHDNCPDGAEHTTQIYCSVVGEFDQLPCRETCLLFAKLACAFNGMSRRPHIHVGRFCVGETIYTLVKPPPRDFIHKCGTTTTTEITVTSAQHLIWYWFRLLSISVLRPDQVGQKIVFE